MDGPGKDLLAGARLTREQDGKVGLGRLEPCPLGFQEALAAAHDVLKAVLVAAVVLVLFPVKFQLGVLAHQPFGRVQGLEPELHLGYTSHDLIGVVKDAGAADQHEVVVVGLGVARDVLVEGQFLAVPPADDVDHLGVLDDLSDGIAHHLVPGPAQEVAVLLVDVSDHALGVHHDEAVVGQAQDLIQNVLVAGDIRFRHGASSRRRKSRKGKP